jgi:hypothetical protein
MGFFKNDYNDQLKDGWVNFILGAVFISVIVLIVMGIYSLSNSGRNSSGRTYYVFNKCVTERDGNSVFVVMLAKNKRPFLMSKLNFEDEQVIKLTQEVSSSVYDSLDAGKNYFPKELTKLGVDLGALKRAQIDYSFLALDKRIELVSSRKVHVIIFLKKKYKNEKNPDNPRLRTEVSQENFINVGLGKYYLLSELRTLGITIPAEKQE